MIAGKAVAFKIAASELFRERQRRTVAGAKAVGEELLGAGHGVSVLTGGTDVHLVLVDLRESELDGQQAEDRLHDVGITVNRNAVPFDPRPPMVTSGLRVGAPALATRGLQADDFTEVGRDHRPGAAAGLRVGAGRARRPRRGRWRSAIRCTPTWASAPRFEVAPANCGWVGRRQGRPRAAVPWRFLVYMRPKVASGAKPTV